MVYDGDICGYHSHMARWKYHSTGTFFGLGPNPWVSRVNWAFAGAAAASATAAWASAANFSWSVCSFSFIVAPLTRRRLSPSSSSSFHSWFQEDLDRSNEPFQRQPLRPPLSTSWPRSSQPASIMQAFPSNPVFFAAPLFAFGSPHPSGRHRQVLPPLALN